MTKSNKSREVIFPLYKVYLRPLLHVSSVYTSRKMRKNRRGNKGRPQKWSRVLKARLIISGLWSSVGSDYQKRWLSGDAITVQREYLVI